MVDRTVPPDSIETSVLAAIAECPPAHVVDVADSLDEHPVTVDRVCARLHDSGYVRPSHHGLYTLTDEGHRRLAETSG